MTAAECPSKVRSSVARGRVPQLQRLVPAARQHAGAVGRERHRVDPVRVPLEGAQQRARGRVPQLERLVLRCPTARGRRRARTPPTLTHSECPSKVRSSAPVAASHSLSVLSAAARQHAGAVGRERHRGDLARVPLEGAQQLPVAASHSFSVLSSLPDSTRAPSGENATELTAARVPLEGAQQRRPWPRPTASASCPSCPTARGAPSGENATELTLTECPSKVRSSAPVAASHSLTVLSVAARQHAGAVGRERNRVDPV